MVDLTPLEIFYGSFTLAFVIISTILGLFIALKYIKFRKLEFLAVGITWILLASPYWSDAVQFILVMIFDRQLNSSLYFFLANAFIAPIHITWIYALTNLLFKKQKQKLLIFFGVEAYLFETFFLTIFFLNPNLIGDQKSVFVAEWAIWIQIYLLISIALFLVTGFLFARVSLKSENPEIKLKGRFLMIAFVTFTVGTVIDVIAAESPSGVTIFSARSFIIISAICFYIGYTMPKFIKELFIKSKST
jgi:hypothetical protein